MQVMQESSYGFEAMALYYVAPHKTELKSVRVPFVAEPRSPEDALIKTLWTGISRGTEKIIYEGCVPVSEYARMRAPFQEGAFPFPVKYGYCAVGLVQEGPPDLQGQAVFVLHPHQDMFAVPAASAIPLPAGLPPRRAVLAANMETALNVVWDSGAGPCDRALVVGAGTLGLLIASILSRIAGIDLTVTDKNGARRAIAEGFGARFALPAETASLEADVVFHTTGTGAGVATCLEACGFEGRVIEASWFGEGDASIPLGGAFHSKRLQIVSSQVGSVSPSRRPRWPHRRRLEAALQLLLDGRLDALITHEVLFSTLPEVLPDILRADADVLTAAVRYD